MEDRQALVPQMDDSVVLRFENRYGGGLTPLCRFCRQPHSLTAPLVVPCLCSHEHRFVHPGCMRRWIAENCVQERPNCQVCKAAINLDVSFCRMCHTHGGLAEGEDRANELIAPCSCEEPVAFVHRSCLTAWFAKDRNRKCPMCGNSLAMRRQLGPTNLTLMTWGVPACRPFHKTAFYILCPLYALTSVGLFLSFLLHAPRLLTLVLFCSFQVIAWILLFIAVFVRVYTEGRFVEFCSMRGNLAPVLPPSAEPRTSEVGLLAASMPLSSPIFQEPRFLRRMVQDFVTDTECFLPGRPADLERSTKSDGGVPAKAESGLKTAAAPKSSYGSI